MGLNQKERCFGEERERASSFLAVRCHLGERTILVIISTLLHPEKEIKSGWRRGNDLNFKFPRGGGKLEMDEGDGRMQRTTELTHFGSRRDEMRRPSEMKFADNK